MESPTFGNPPFEQGFHWLVIDGPSLVCINGTGDLPLVLYTIDPAKCSFEAATTPPGDKSVPIVGVPPGLVVPTTPIPEPSTYALVAAGLLFAALARKRRA